MAAQRRIRLTREGVIFLLVMLSVLIGALVRQLNLLMLLGSALAGPIAFSLIYGRLALRRLVIHRKLPTHLNVERRLKVDVSVTNRRRWLAVWSIEVEDRLQREGSATGAVPPSRVSVYFPRIGGRQTLQVDYEGRLRQRGRYRFGPLRISTRFPLGLVRHSLFVPQTGELIVHPRLGRLTHDWTSVLRESASGQQSMQRRGLLEADFYGLRDWRPGDNRRSIHWRTSARRGSLVVRQFEQRRSQDLALLVDLWQPREPSPEHLARVETAVSFVATLLNDASRQPGRQLILHLAAATPVSLSGTASPLLVREQMDALAVVEPHGEDVFPATLVDALSAIPLSMPAMIVSTRNVDRQALDALVGQTHSTWADRLLRTIDVGSDELSNYYHE
jgi:uncharacterized protein (DUF58 family)